MTSRDDVLKKINSGGFHFQAIFLNYICDKRVDSARLPYWSRRTAMMMYSLFLGVNAFRDLKRRRNIAVES
jgi:hypothetical protein